MTVITAQKTSGATLVRGSLRVPVVGTALPGDPAGPGRTPGANGPLGLWFETFGTAEAVALGIAKLCLPAVTKNSDKS